MKNDRPTSEILHSRDFYETLRNEVAPCMTLVAVCDEGKLYFWDDFVSLMMVVGTDFVVLSYAWARDPEESVKLIRECYKAIHDPAKIDKMARLFCYTASFDAETGCFQLHDVRGGDWLGIYPRAKRSALRKLYNRLPHGWPESYRSIIESLNRGRGEDDSLASNHDRLTTRLNHTLHTIRFADTAATFDAQYGRVLPLHESELSPFHFPIETCNLGPVEKRHNFKCHVDIAAAHRYLSECGFIVDTAQEIALSNGYRIEVPSYGLAALAFIEEQLPDVTQDGKAFFSQSLRILPNLDLNYEQLMIEPGYRHVGSGIVALKALFEGLLGLGGDLFPDRKLRMSFGELEMFYHGVMGTALEIQERVIVRLTGPDSGYWTEQKNL